MQWLLASNAHACDGPEALVFHVRMPCEGLPWREASARRVNEFLRVTFASITEVWFFDRSPFLVFRLRNSTLLQILFFLLACCFFEQEQWEIAKLKMLQRFMKMAQESGHSHSHAHGESCTGHVSTTNASGGRSFDFVIGLTITM